MARISRTFHFFFPPLPPPSCILLSSRTWDIFTPIPREMEGWLKMKRKTISSADGSVWGNEIACLIVACNGEQFEVNWGEIGHWASVCWCIVVWRRVYQWENHWSQRKKYSLSDHTNGNYLALADKRARSIVTVIQFIFFSLVSGSGSQAWKHHSESMFQPMHIKMQWLSSFSIS